MPLITKKLAKMNVSIQYDTLTLYPTVKTKVICDRFMEFTTACGQMGFYEPGDLIDRDILDASRYDASLIQFKDYDRFVHRNDPDHGLYHQDQFTLDDEHWHFKCKSMLTYEKLKAIFDLAIKHGIMTQNEEMSILGDFKQKYQIDIEKIAQDLTKSKNQAIANKDIHNYVKTCMDLDALVYLHEQLLLPKYDFLRGSPEDKPQQASSSVFFRGVISKQGVIGDTSKTWAEIEECIELQMMHILDTTCRMNSKIGQARAKELHSDAPFFGIKHQREINHGGIVEFFKKIFESDSDDSDIMKLLKNGDTVNLEREYKKHFKTFN